MVDEARAGFVDEVDEVIEHDAQRFDDHVHGTASHDDSRRDHAARDHAASTPERSERVVVHRFTRRDNDPATAPRRIVTLRDARLGRPKRPTRKHGADPPV